MSELRQRRLRAKLAPLIWRRTRDDSAEGVYILFLLFDWQIWKTRRDMRSNQLLKVRLILCHSLRFWVYHYNINENLVAEQIRNFSTGLD